MFLGRIPGKNSPVCLAVMYKNIYPVCLAVMYKNIYPANKWLDYKCIAGTKA
jgi:hypothetical protein